MSPPNADIYMRVSAACRCVDIYIYVYYILSLIDIYVAWIYCFCGICTGALLDEAESLAGETLFARKGKRQTKLESPRDKEFKGTATDQTDNKQNARSNREMNPH